MNLVQFEIHTANKVCASLSFDFRTMTMAVTLTPPELAALAKGIVQANKECKAALRIKSAEWKKAVRLKNQRSMLSNTVLAQEAGRAR